MQFGYLFYFFEATSYRIWQVAFISCRNARGGGYSLKILLYQLVTTSLTSIHHLLFLSYGAQLTSTSAMLD